MTSKSFLAFIGVFAMLASLAMTQVGRAADLAKPMEQAEASQMPKMPAAKSTVPDSLRAINIFYVTKSPCRGAFRIAAAGGRGVYEYAGVPYDTTWQFISEDANFYYFKENGYNFWAAFARSTGSNGLYAVWVSNNKTDWYRYADAAIYTVSKGSENVTK